MVGPSRPKARKSSGPMNEKRKKSASKVVPLRPRQEGVPPIPMHFGTIESHSPETGLRSPLVSRSPV